MTSSKHAPALAAVCTLLFATAPALADNIGNPDVVQGLGPRGAAMQRTAAPARPAPGPDYGGGFIEFLVTGHSRPAVPEYRATAHVPGPSASAAPQDESLYEPTLDPTLRPVPGYAAPRKAVDPMFVRQEVPYAGHFSPGTVVVDTANKFLYLVEPGGQALRYGIGVGRPGFLWQGEKTITRKAEWPGWTPPAEMVKRRPDLPSHMDGGITNPLGARAMYLGSSLYRIHGTNEPDTIGTNVSSGCIRLTNDDVSDLFGRVHVGTHVVVL